MFAVLEALALPPPHSRGARGRTWIVVVGAFFDYPFITIIGKTVLLLQSYLERPHDQFANIWIFF